MSSIRILRISMVLLAALFVCPALRYLESQANYRLVENWAQLPAATQWGVMSAVGVDSKDNVYAFQRDEPTSKVMVFDSHGKFLRSWGDGTFPYPHGLRILRDGNVWVTDRKMQQVVEFSPTGDLLMTIGQKNEAGDNNSTDKFNGVSDVVMAPNGDLFVSDGEGANTRVVKISKDGKFIKFWGSKGSLQGQFDGPHCIAMDSKGRVWVGDRGNKRIEIFDQDGNYLDQMTQFGTPASIFITAGDTVYVAAPAPENRVTIGTLDGQILQKIEGLNSAHGIAVDSTGAIYVAESSGKAVLKYTRE